MNIELEIVEGVVDREKLRRAFIEVLAEVRTATKKYGGFASPHEVLGVLDEEFTEFKAEVMQRDFNDFAARGELAQVAAVALRAMMFLDDFDK